MSRTKNFLLQNIEKPDDELIIALLVKNLSDRQISIQKKLIDYIIKRIDRNLKTTSISNSYEIEALAKEILWILI